MGEDIHVVVVNDEEQAALWPGGRDLPAGWTQVFGPASEDHCLSWVEEHWTDIRPASLRRWMIDHGRPQN